MVDLGGSSTSSAADYHISGQLDTGFLTMTKELGMTSIGETLKGARMTRFGETLKRVQGDK